MECHLQQKIILTWNKHYFESKENITLSQNKSLFWLKISTNINLSHVDMAI